MSKPSRIILSILYFIPLYFFWIGVFPYILGNRIVGPNYIAVRAFVMGSLFPHIIANIAEKRGYSWWKNYLISGFLCTGIPFIGIIWLIYLWIRKNIKNNSTNNFSIAKIMKGKKIENELKLINNINYKDLLINNNLDEYIPLFEKNKLNNLEIIMNLNENDYEKLGIELMGDRKRFLKIFSKEEIKNYLRTLNGEKKSEDIIEEKDKYQISDEFLVEYKELKNKLLMLYPVSIRSDIENIEKTQGFDVAKNEIIRLIENKRYITKDN